MPDKSRGTAKGENLPPTHQILDRKASEEELRLLEQRFEIVARLTNDAIWDWQLSNNQLWWNAGFQNLFGYGPNDIAPSIEYFYKRLHPEDRERVAADIRAVLETQREFWSAEFRFLRKSGEFAHVLARGFVLHDGAQKPVRLVAAMEDITLRKRAEQEIRDLASRRAAQLEAAMREIDTLSYSISHDLRAPLRAIEGFSKILIEDYSAQLDVDAKKFLEVIVGSAGEMGQLIDGVLAYSRAGRQVLAPSLLDMQTLVDGVAREWRHRERDRAWRCEIATLPSAYGDLAAMTMVWSELFQNALKFSRGRPETTIRVGGVVRGAEVEYSISDTGAGFDMAYGHKLFGIFQRLHRKGDFEGSGAGLAVTQRLVTRQGGRIWADAKVGEGSTFWFTLPQQCHRLTR